MYTWNELSPSLRREYIRMARGLMDAWGTMNLPEAARTTDPATSHSSMPVSGVRKQHCLNLLRIHARNPRGLTDREAAAKAHLLETPSCWWKRCSDLRSQGLIEPVADPDTGAAVTVLGPLGRPVQVSRITKIGTLFLSTKQS